MRNRTKNYPYYESPDFHDLREITETIGEKYSDRYALSYRNRPNDTEPSHITFREFRDKVRGLATAAIERGLCGKKVAIVGESTPGWVVSYFAFMSMGAVTVPMDNDYVAEDLIATMNTAECAAIVYSAALKDKLEKIRAGVPTLKCFIAMGEKLSPDDFSLDELIAEGLSRLEAGDRRYFEYEIDRDALASLVFTSGTTGKGKGVMLSSANIIEDMHGGMYNFSMGPRTMMVLPPHHTYGSSVVFVGHLCQGIEIYLSSGLRYIVKEMQEFKPDHLVLVPLFVETFHKRIWTTIEKKGKAKTVRFFMKVSNLLLKIGIDLREILFRDVLDTFGGDMRLIVCGGAALRQDIIDDFESFGITVLNGYGITECAPLISCNRNEYRKTGTVGTPIVGQEVKIDSPNENGEGEICARGRNVMLGYYHDKEATAAAIDEDGYFHTGDIGKITTAKDGTQWITITGRIKNLIILSNGKNVYPEEIEAEITRIPGVAETVVYEGISRSDATKEVIVAEIYPDFDTLKLHGIEDATAYFNKEIAALNTRMVHYKHIGLVKIREEEFPKNTTRKIVRFKIDHTID